MLAVSFLLHEKTGSSLRARDVVKTLVCGYCYYNSKMASRKVLASKVYQRFLQICEQWPVDNSRAGRDLGAHIKENFGLRIKDSQMEVSKHFQVEEIYHFCCATCFQRVFGKRKLEEQRLKYRKPKTKTKTCNLSASKARNNLF